MHPLPPLILLDAGDGPFAFVLQIGGAVLGLIAVVVVGWFAIVRIRAWMNASEDASAPFTLDDLRQLHRAGKLTDEEFQRAREAMIGAVRSQKAKESSRAGGPVLDPELARQINMARDDNGAESRAERRMGSGVTPTGKLPEANDPPRGAMHGETVVRRPDILRRPPEDGSRKNDE